MFLKGCNIFRSYFILWTLLVTTEEVKHQSQRGTVEETRHYYHWYGYRINPTGQSLKLIVETSKIQSKWFQRKDYCSTTLEWTRRYLKMVSRIKHRQTVVWMTLYPILISINWMTKPASYSNFDILFASTKGSIITHICDIWYRNSRCHLYVITTTKNIT